MPFVSDGFYRADSLSQGQDRLMSRPLRQLFGLCRRDSSYKQGEKTGGQNMLSQRQYKHYVNDKSMVKS